MYSVALQWLLEIQEQLGLSPKRLIRDVLTVISSGWYGPPLTLNSHHNHYRFNFDIHKIRLYTASLGSTLRFVATTILNLGISLAQGYLLFLVVHLRNTACKCF